MTKVYLEQNGNHFLVSCQGHATGSSEMCAAISCLVYTLAGWLKNSATIVLEERLEEGNARISFFGNENAETAYDMVTVGFLQLEATDPEHIFVEHVLV